MKKYKREGINIQDNNLIFDYSNNDGIRVSFGTKQIKFHPYKTKINDDIVFSLYQVDSTNKSILRALKGESNLEVAKKI